LKTHFHEECAQFASFETNAPVQQQGLITAYETAHKKALTPRNLRAGFKAAGTWPQKLEPLLESLVAANRPPLDLASPRTPPNPLTIEEMQCYTPKNSDDVKQQLFPQSETMSGFQRVIRTIAEKTGRRIDLQNAQITALQQRNQFLESKIASIERQGHTRVKKNPNEAFASFGSIERARTTADNIT
jgi:hypothetical protein